MYSQASPAGKGTKWEWGGPAGSDWNCYNMDVQCIIEEAWAKGEQTLDLGKTNIGLPYTINFCNLSQIRHPNGPIRSIRRIQQAPYPLVKITSNQITPSPTPSMSIRHNYATSTAQPNIIHHQAQMHQPPLHHQQQQLQPQRQQYQQQQLFHHQKNLHHSSNQMPNISSYQQAHHKYQLPSPLPPPPPPPTLHHSMQALSSSASSSSSTTSTKRQTKHAKSKQNIGSETTTTNLARQILNNLNIFSHKPTQAAANVCTTVTTASATSLTTTMSSTYSGLRDLHPHQRAGSHRSRSRSRGGHCTDDSCSLASVGRRPSVDTVSTYLSHESKDSSRSQNIGSVSDLLDCSIGSDDVFVPPQIPGSIVGKIF